ncbi:MAG: hypothetical protein AB1806_10515 [Acidobacteriota bacterium]
MSPRSCAAASTLTSRPGLRAPVLALGAILLVPASSAAQVTAPDGGPVASCAGQGFRIGTITVERLDVLDLRSTGLVGWIERSANSMHVQTRERVIRRHLLFREGDECDDEALAQTERNLRATGLFQKVDVHASPSVDQTVDVTIRARDAWSLRISGEFGHLGGKPAWEAGLTEANLAGSGAGIGLRHRSRFEADVTTAWFADERFLGLREWLGVRYDERSDGRSRAASLVRPFYSLDSRWGHEFSAAETRDHLRLYEDGLITHEYRRRSVETIAGVALRVASPSATSVWRLATGFRFSAREYEPNGTAPAGDPLLPPSHRLAGPYLNLHFVQHRFLKRTGLFVPGRDTDINLGTQLDLGLFVSRPIAGLATTARVSVGAAASRGWSLPHEGLLVGTAFVSGDFGGVDERRGDAGGSLRAWWQRSPTHVLATLLEARWRLNPDSSGRLYLGGSPGLRGYREYALWGTQSVLVIVEDRKFFGWTLARLFQFGVAGFAEGGAVGGATSGSAGWRGAANVGAGLRIAQLRTSSNSAVRIDVAFPLVAAPDGRRQPQLVIGYRGDY